MRNHLKTVILLGALSLLVIGIGAAVGKVWLYVAFGAALIINFVSYFYSDRIVLRMQRAKEVDASILPHIHRIVHELVVTAGIPMPRVYLIESGQPNAFATGRNPQHAAVAVTTGLLEVLNERELRGVIAHELAHVKNRDILVGTIAAVFAGVVTSIANGLQWFAFAGMGNQDDEGGSPMGTLAMALLAPLAATMIQLGISRSREYGADAAGAQISGDPEGLALALAKIERAARGVEVDMNPATASLFIVNPFAGMQGVISLFSTHPATSERIRRLREMVYTPLGRAA